MEKMKLLIKEVLQEIIIKLRRKQINDYKTYIEYDDIIDVLDTCIYKMIRKEFEKLGD